MSGRRSGASPSEEHRVFDELAVGWALHSLEPEDEAVFAGHLPGCERCAQTVADTTEVMATMAADLPRAEPSDRLRERLHAAVAETEQLPPGDVPREPVRPAATGFPGYRSVEAPAAPVPLRRRAPVMALAAAAVAAIVGLGVWNVFLSDSRSDLEATVAQQERIVDSLLTPGQVTVEALSADDGSVVATVVARSDRVDIISHALAPNDTEDQTYVLWGIDDTGPKAIAPFDVDWVTDDAADRRLRLDRSRRVRPVRDQPRTRSGGSVGTDGHRRERVGGPAERTGDRGASGPSRPRPGDPGRAARPLRRRRDAQPAGARRATRAGAAGWPRAARSTTPTGSASASSAG